jgi:uncharacterized protein YciI
MHWILLYSFSDSYRARREEVQPRHLVHVHDAFDSGLLIIGGSLAEPADGAVVVFESPDESAVKRWVEEDPYVREGLVMSWVIRRWNAGIGIPQTRSDP